MRDRVASLMPPVREELAEFVAFESVADPRQFPPEGCARAAEWLLTKFAQLGFDDVHLEKTPDGSDAVVGYRASANPGAPTVLLYSHYDVQPPLDDAAWRTPPFQLTEVNGRWYGRGAADSKGNIMAHLLALRALDGDVPVNLRVVFEGSEEAGTGGLEAFVQSNPELFRADAILICDTGNAAVGRPATTVSLRGMVNVVVTVETMATELHSGMFGGAAPDALAALIAMLASLRDRRGNTTVGRLDNTQRWTGAPYPPEQFRADAAVFDGVAVLGDGSVSDMLWARPAITVLGIDCPSVTGSTAAISSKVAARLNLRVPPGMAAVDAETALGEHLREVAPWGARVQVDTEAVGSPFEATIEGPAFEAMTAAMEEAFGREMTTLGQGGSIPLCNVFAEVYPAAEMILMGVEEPLALIHAPNESVDPAEIEAMAVTVGLFFHKYATLRARRPASETAKAIS